MNEVDLYFSTTFFYMPCVDPLVHVEFFSPCGPFKDSIIFGLDNDL